MSFVPNKILVEALPVGWPQAARGIVKLSLIVAVSLVVVQAIAMLIASGVVDRVVVMTLVVMSAL